MASGSDLERIKALFKKQDTNGDGQIDRAEMSRILLMMSCDFTAAETDELFDQADKDANGMLDYDEFLSWLFEEKEQEVQGGLLAAALSAVLGDEKKQSEIIRHGIAISVDALASWSMWSDMPCEHQNGDNNEFAGKWVRVESTGRFGRVIQSRPERNLVKYADASEAWEEPYELEELDDLESARLRLRTTFNVRNLEGVVEQCRAAGMDDSELEESSRVLRRDGDAFQVFAARAIQVATSTPDPWRLMQLLVSELQGEEAGLPNDQVQVARRDIGFAKYTDPMGLEGVVSSGAVAFVRGSHIQKLAGENGKVQRRQDMPAEAFWSPEDLVRHMKDSSRTIWHLPGAECHDFRRGQYVLHALSYCWLDPGHPDAEGYHIRHVDAYLEMRRQFVGKTCGLEDVALFWDFPTLFQSPRTDAQDALFRVGLCAANLIYGHSSVTVLMNTKNPESSGRSYFQSGWCTFESAVSSLAKHELMIYDLASPCDDALATHKKRYLTRPVPITPEALKEELAKADFKSKMKDSDLVVRLYEETFQAISRGAEKVRIEQHSWTRPQAEKLKDALPQFENCRTLLIHYPPIEGIDLVVEGIAKMPRITKMRLGGFNFCPMQRGNIAELVLRSSFVPAMLTNLLIAWLDNDIADACLEWLPQAHALQSLGSWGHCMDADKMTSVREAWETANKDPQHLAFSMNDMYSQGISNFGPF